MSRHIQRPRKNHRMTHDAPTPIVTNAAVRRRWEDVLAARATVGEASAWAEQVLDTNAWDDELTLQGLLQLQAATVVTELATPHLEKWLAELDKYEQDSEAWNRAYFTRTLQRFAAQHGNSAPMRFAAKLVLAGHLTTSDVDNALDTRGVPPESGSPVA